MANSAPPSSIRSALAESAKVAASVNPNVGFGSRTPRPEEDPNKSEQSWSGFSQLTALEVDWNSKYTTEWAEDRDKAKTTPAGSFQVTFVTELSTGQAHTWKTGRALWVYGDIDEVIPLGKGKWATKNRDLARRDMALIKGYFQALLGTSANDPILNYPDQCVAAIDQMLAAIQPGQAFVVKCGWTKKTQKPYKIQNGPKAGQMSNPRVEYEDFIYETVSRGEAPAPAAA